jgi:hypothetical protein
VNGEASWPSLESVSALIIAGISLFLKGESTGDRIGACSLGGDWGTSVWLLFREELAMIE